MDELLAKLTIDDLPDSQRDIAEMIGMDNYLKLVRLVSGDSIYICKEDELRQNILRSIRDAEIRRRFNGYNFAALAREYNLATRTVRRIVGETAASHVAEGQLSVFDD